MPDLTRECRLDLADDQKDSPAELAFKYAVYQINQGNHVLRNHSLIYDIQYVPREDSFRTTKKVCGQIEHGIVALFGPSDHVLGSHLQSLCDALDIPLLEARLLSLSSSSLFFSSNIAHRVV